jgi:LPXTG-site transpeptidase (sortase) family protein
VLLTLVALVLGVVVTRGGAEDVAIDPDEPRATPSCIQDPEPTARSTSRPDPARGRPLRLLVPSLDVDAEVRPIGLEGEALVPPDDVTVVGWWRDGALPGSRRGTALLAGHTWSAGDGVFDELAGLESGDRIVVTTPRGRIDYSVEVTTTYSLDDLARVSERLFSQEVAGRLVVTTCADYRDGAYQANTVVVARPVSTTRQE